MRIIQAIAGATLLLSSLTVAAACEIEDWRFYQLTSNVVIEGTTTCSEGKLIIRAYDGGTKEYLGNATAYIEGHTFEAMISNASASELSIKYNVK